jgi:hypothetical protein
MAEMDAMEMVNGLLAMVRETTMAQAVQKGIDAYDHYATAAMTVILQKHSDDYNADKIAEFAWDFADAMMAERRKRGLGGVMVPPAPEPSTRVVFDGNGGSGGESS